MQFLCNRCQNQQIKPVHFIQCCNNFMFLCIMDDDPKEMLTTLLPALTKCQQPPTQYLRQLLRIVCVMILPYPDPFLDIRHRSWNGQIEIRTNAKYFPISYHTDTRFIQPLKKNPESLLRLTRNTRHMFLNETGRYYTLSPVNRSMMYMLLLRSYPSYHNLALIVNVSVATVHNDINSYIRIKKEALERCVQQPTISK